MQAEKKEDTGPKTIYNCVALVGVGLIGSSIARAVRKFKLANSIYGYSHHRDRCEEIRKLGLCDLVFDNLKESVSQADLIILCTPVLTFSDLVQEMAPFIKAGATLSDVGSVKCSVLKELEAHRPPDVHLIPGHPIAGTEHSGPAAGFAELFENRWHILTPSSSASIVSIEKLTRFWENMGAKVELMSPEHHDRVLAMTSHLPHLLAYSLVSSATHMEKALQAEIVKYSAGGFRDSTRIVASDPAMWRDIFLTNGPAILQMLDHFEHELKQMRTSILQKDGNWLYETFSATRAVRAAVIEAGQAGHFSPCEKDTSELTASGFLGLYGS